MNKKKSIMLFAVDPGGSNSIGVLSQELSKNYVIHSYAREAAYKHLLENNPGIKVTHLHDKYCQYSEHMFLKLLKKLNPSVVITDTASRDYSNRSLWQACKLAGIPSIAILDQWMSYSVRFLKEHKSYQDKQSYEIEEYNLPQVIVVMDQSAKTEMVKEGIPEKMIYPIGSPYYQKLNNFSKVIKQKSKQDLQILFASEPITSTYGHTLGKHIHGYTERSTIHALCQSIEKSDYKRKIGVSIRPHPREPKQRYKQLLSRYKFVKLCRSKTVYDSISCHNVIIGMSSTMLLEGAFINKPIISIQIGNHGSSPFYLEQIGLTQSLRYTFELKRLIENILRNNLKRYQVNIDSKGNAIESISDLIESL